MRHQLTQESRRIDWGSYKKNLLNRNDVESIWDKIDHSKIAIQKEEMYKVFGEHSGEHIVGLTNELSDAEIKDLINTNKDKFQAMASNKRRKNSEEFRCVQQCNGQIQWYNTLIAIQKFCTANRYTHEMVKDCVFDIARQQFPDFDPFFQTLDLQTLSDHLIGRDPIMYKQEVFLKPLKSLVRQIGVSLFATMHNAQELWKLAYEKPNSSLDESNKNFDQTYLQFSIDTLCKMTAKPVSAKIKEYIFTCKNNGKKFAYKDLLTAAIQLETNDEFKPSSPLPLEFLDQNDLSIKINAIDIGSKKLQFKTTISDTDSSSDEEIFTTSESKQKKKLISTIHTTTKSTAQALQLTLPTELAITTRNVTYIQAKADASFLKTRHPNKYEQIINKTIATIKTLMKGNEDRLDKIYGDLTTRLRSKMNDRMINAIVFDENVLNLLDTSSTTHNQKFDITISCLDTKKKVEEENASFNSMQYRNFNKNNDYFLKQMRNKSPNDYREKSTDRRFEYNRNYDSAQNYRRSPERSRYQRYQNQRYNRSNSRDTNRQKNRYYSSDHDRQTTPSRDRQSRDRQSRDRYRNRYDSEDRLRQKSQDNYRQRRYNNRSMSPFTRDSTKRESSYSNNSRRQYRHSNRSMSPFTRDNMKRGLNCPDDYQPDKRFCAKCMTDTHHPWLCQKFKTWRREKCRTCENGFHCDTECYNRINE